MDLRIPEPNFNSGKKFSTPESLKRTLPTATGSGMRDDSKNPKLYVGGLSLNTTRTQLKEYFEQYGRCTEVIIMMDKRSRTSKGFGFVTFLEAETATRVNMLSHIIDGRRVDCKKARPKDVFGDWDGKSEKLVTTKIFVGGLPYDICKEEFVNVFTAYGEVVDCVIIPDKQTEMSRCFGFLQFRSPTSVDRVMQNYYDIKVRGIWLECKRTVPRDSERFVREMEQELEGGNKAKPTDNILFERQEDNYDSQNYEMYDFNDDLKFPQHMADSPPIYPTPGTPPHVRAFGYRTKYLEKRERAETEIEKVNFNFDEGGFNYFDYLQEKNQTKLKKLKVQQKNQEQRKPVDYREMQKENIPPNYLDYKNFMGGFDKKQDPKYNFSDEKKPQMAPSLTANLSFKTPSRKNLNKYF